MRFCVSHPFPCIALRVFKINFGESHTEVASCLCSIGTVCDEMGEEEQALSYFKKALAAVKGQSGAKGVRASALHNVGIILTKRMISTTRSESSVRHSSSRLLTLNRRTCPILSTASQTCFV